jgi:pimeloyl-ACP methyl ester carboxylesterase
MPSLATDDGVKLYYEETGAGKPIVFVHELPDPERLAPSAHLMFSKHIIQGVLP